MKTDTSRHEQEIAGLKEKIAYRLALAETPAASTPDGKPYNPPGLFGGRSVQFIDSMRVRLRQLEHELVHARIESGEYEPSEIIERMSK